MKTHLKLLTITVALCSLSLYAADIKPDKLSTCPVSGEKLNGDMGKPFIFVYQGQEVQLCCKSCKKDFDKDPAKYIAKIRLADKMNQ